ncbi:MAG: hypothetical protein NC302_02020 [Bacteroidales bacterium]|nr:hypothetical protein [Bacteroidales bacterium]MCM1415796.1 hypothetical protein [bacterium]MCM1422710.1 hypothetical protein [bacterium]
MAEQYRDSYQNKYKEETAQIHAPKSLIEKTKAAVREEEMRLARKAAPVGAYEQSEAKAGNRKTFSAHKWTYPLTAAAALLILVSVSRTMRGLQPESGMSASPAYEEAAESGAAYDDSVAEDVYEDAAVEAAKGDAGFAAGEAEASAPEEIAEAPAADIWEDAADTAATNDLATVQNADDAMFADAGRTDGLSRAAEELTAAEEKLEAAESEATEKENAVKKKSAAADEQIKETAGADELTIKKVAKRPVRFYTSGVKIRSYEGMTFRILEEKDGGNVREAYVETEDGGKYVLRSETLDEEAFLAAAWEELNFYCQAI